MSAIDNVRERCVKGSGDALDNAIYAAWENGLTNTAMELAEDVAALRAELERKDAAIERIGQVSETWAGKTDGSIGDTFFIIANVCRAALK
jgi:hypothetical protein